MSTNISFEVLGKFVFIPKKILSFAHSSKVITVNDEPEPAFTMINTARI